MSVAIDPGADFETNFEILYGELRKQLPGNAAKWKLFACLVIGILCLKTVNLSDIALAGPERTKPESFYRRLQRFFQNFDFPRVAFARLLLSLFPGDKHSLTLAMDRTNWKFGRRHINILQIGAVFGGVLYPLVWKTLPQKTRRGNSDTSHRCGLMGELLKAVPAGNIKCLLMDREFNGREWLGWLDGRNIPFALRVKGNALLDGESAAGLAGKAAGTSGGQTIREGQGCPVFFAAGELRGGDEKWLLVIGNRHSGKELLELYRLRWGIECFFGHLKSKGFDFEQTHMTEAGRIDKLMGALALAFVFSHRRGLEEEKVEKKLP